MTDDTSFFRGQQVPESVKARLLQAQLAQQLAAQQERPYSSGGVVALKALGGFLGGMQEKQAIDGEQQAQAAHRQALAQLLMQNASPSTVGAAAPTFGAGAASAAGTSPGMGIPTSAAASGAGGSDFFGRLGQIESGNRDVISNKASGATGRYQFIGSTWDRLSKQYPELGLTPDGRTDPAQQQRAIQAFTNDNVSALGRSGFDPTPGNLYLAHFAGAGGATAALKADPSTPVDQVIGGAAVRANPFLRGKTAGDLVQWANGKMAGVDPSTVPGVRKGNTDPGIVATPQTAAGQLAAVTGSDAVPKTGVGNPDPGLMVTPAAAATLAGGQGADTLGAPSPFGAPPSPMVSPSGADPKALAAALRASVPGAPPPGSDTVQPPVIPDPQGSLTAPSPFGAGPSPMVPMSPSPNSQALAAALRQSVQQPPAPTMPTPTPQDPTGGLSPNGLQMAALGGGDLSGLAGMAQAAPPVSAAPLSTDNAVGMDSFGDDGSVRQSSLGAPGFTGAPDDGSAAAAINGNLPGPQAYVGGPLGLGTGPVDPSAPSPAMLAQALKQSAGTPTPAPMSPPAQAPVVTPPAPPPAQVAALPGADDPLGGLMGSPDGAKPSLSDITTAAMAKAGYDTSPLTGAMPPQGSVAGLGPAASARVAAAAAPMMADPNVPGPDLSGLGAPTTPPPPGAALPIMARAASNPPAVLAQALRASSPAGPSMRPAGDTTDTTLPDTGPMPPPGAQTIANAAAPAPGAANAGPAPLSPGLLAQALRTSQPQPLGLAGDGGADPSSARAFLTSQAPGQGGGASPSLLAQVLRGNSPATASATAPAPSSSPANPGPLDGLGRLFNFGGGSSGGNPLSGIPIIGDLFGGGQGQQAPASYGGGQGQQGAPFTPGGQGVQPGQAGAPAAGGQAPSGLGGMSQAQALALLSDPRTSPQDAQLIMSRAFPQPMIEKTSDGKIVSIDPRGGPARVLYAGQGYRPATADERKSYGITDDRPFSFGPDGKPEFGAVDPNSKETTEVRDYNMVVKQAQAAGQTPPTFSDYQTNLRRSGAATVTVDQKAETAMAQARGAGLGKRLNEVADDSSKVAAEGIQVARIRDLLGSVDTGPGTAYAEKFRQTTGIPLDPKTDKVQALQAAVQNLAPALRVPGSGSQSDTELRNFQASIPGLMNTPGGNEQILQTLEGAIAYRQQRSTIAQAWQRGDIDPKTADAQIAALPSPFAKPAASPSGSNAPASAPVGLQPAPQAAPVPQGGGLGGGYLPGAARPQAGFTAPPTASAAPPQAAPAPSDALAQAQAAIARGAPRAAVIQRLQAAGINPAGL